MKAFRHQGPRCRISGDLPIISALFLSLVVPSPAYSGDNTRTLHIELSYSGIATSYNLYKNGKLACSSKNKHKSQIDCSVKINPSPMTFTLTAVDDNGIESPPSAPYILHPPKTPTAQFSTSVMAQTTPATVSFDGSKSVDFDGMILRYVWDFGDGTTGSGEFIDHTYYSPGSYIAQLTVIDDDNQSAEVTSQITVDSIENSSNDTGAGTSHPPVSTPVPTNEPATDRDSPPEKSTNADTLPQRSTYLQWIHLLYSFISRLLNNL